MDYVSNPKENREDNIQTRTTEALKIQNPLALITGFFTAATNRNGFLIKF